MAGNLSRVEAVRRAELLSIDTYEIELDLTTGPTEFGSTTRIRFHCREIGAETFVELADASLDSATLNGAPLDPACYAAGRLRLAGLGTDNELVVHARCRYSSTGEGLHRFVDPVDGAVYLYSYFAPADAQRVYACFDQPDLKAAFELTVTAPAGWVVVAAAPPDRAGEPSAPGAALWHFPATAPLPTYVTAVVAGPYHGEYGEYRSIDGRRIPLGVRCRASLAPHLDAARILEITTAGMAYFEDLFGMPYPFQDYDQTFVPEFNMGAMENAACVTLREEYVFRSRPVQTVRDRRAETILHELAHMWFGDLVTMRWWDDLWLNESFATFAGLRCQAEALGNPTVWTTFTIRWKTDAYRQDQLPSTHPVAADIPDVQATQVNLDSITYLKGAAIVRQLAAYVGDEAFTAGLRRYFRRHAWGNTTLSDFLAVMAETSGRPVHQWSRQWLETAGVSTLRAAVVAGSSCRLTAAAIHQEVTADHPTPREHRLAVGLYRRAPGGLVRVGRVELDAAGGATEIPELAGADRPALLLVNDDDLTYAKIRLDDQSLATVVDTLAAARPVGAEPLTDALCWSILWDMTRDGELPARSYLAVLRAWLGTGPVAPLLEILLGQAGQAVREYVPAPDRRAERMLLSDSLAGLVAGAEPGSEAQLPLVQALADNAVGPAHLESLRDLLAGHRTVPGLAMEPDLRWHLLRRLVAADAAGEPEIDAELARDPSAAGHRAAAACRAAVPTPEAKAAAWKALVSGDLPNALFRRTLDGFADPDHADILRPYQEAYYGAAETLWAARPGEVARQFAVGAFPRWDISPSTLTRVDAYLADATLEPPLRRLMVENRADLARALHTHAATTGRARRR